MAVACTFGLDGAGGTCKSQNSREQVDWLSRLRETVAALKQEATAQSIDSGGGGEGRLSSFT